MDWYNTRYTFNNVDPSACFAYNRKMITKHVIKIFPNRGRIVQNKLQKTLKLLTIWWYKGGHLVNKA